MDQLIEAAKKYWGITAVLVSGIGAFGSQGLVDTTNPFVLFVMGLILFCSAYVIGRSAGKEVAGEEARRNAERDFEIKAKELESDYKLSALKSDRQHDSEVQEIRRQHDQEVAKLKKIIEDTYRDIDEADKELDELKRFKRIAELDLRDLERLKNEFDLRRFSPEQKRAMLKCWEIEQHGEEGGVMAELDNPVCDALVDAGVLRCSADRVQGWNYQFNFEPKWRRYLAEHIGDLESEAGPIE